MLGSFMKICRKNPVSVKIVRKISALHINPSNTESNPICHLLALLGAHYILHVSRIRVKTWVYVTVVSL
jgi:hypothetical protein